MKRLTLLFLIVFSSCMLFAQDNGFVAFDTNGPMGECLFPKSDRWEEVYECAKTKDEILEDVQKCLLELPTSQDVKCKVNNEKNIGSLFTFDIQVYIGNVPVDVPFVGLINKQFSEVKFKAKIEVKDKKYRVTFAGFNTDRMTIRGDAKSDGPSNMIHWQRVNSLTKERAKASKKKTAEYDAMIEREEKAYVQEWNAVSKIMDAFKHCTEEADF